MRETPVTNRDPLHEPSLTRFPLEAAGRAAVLRAHDAAMAEGQAGYTDPQSGFFVMTAATLLNRGFCCGCGCRHCPYID